MILFEELFIVFLFVEITTRILTANSSSRGTLFMILLPWIHNIELVDLAISKGVNGHDMTLQEEQGNAFLQGTGWGSVQSTELVLNNLFYLTATVSLPLSIHHSSIAIFAFSSPLNMHPNWNCYGMR